MRHDTARYRQAGELLAEYGLILRGGFWPSDEDEVPGAPATLLLVGNAGPAMWESFSALPIEGENALDQWSKCAIDAVADNLGATALYPYGGPPFLPFLRWAQKAEAVKPSPIGMMMHPEFGLWHAYRGALCFNERLGLPVADERDHPCDSCDDKPCLDGCPVNAFSGGAYDVPACRAHLATDDGVDCMSLGCRARRACPAGAPYRYAPDQAAFHMQAFRGARPMSDE
ncbi:MAG: ferredoxin [Rhodospirillaceae bacterium]|nr:ferredoxin [Rhodospirillaceae bacterium]